MMASLWMSPSRSSGSSPPRDWQSWKAINSFRKPMAKPNWWEPNGSEVRIPVKVSNATVRPAISFKKDVMPVLTRSGCNTGSCHGAARGKDGFRLSLFGFDPDGDHFRVTREIGARRINLAVPEESLFLKKAIGAVPHTGGKLFDIDSPYYAIMLEWLRDGAPIDPADSKPPAV